MGFEQLAIALLVGIRVVGACLAALGLAYVCLRYLQLRFSLRDSRRRRRLMDLTNSSALTNISVVLPSTSHSVRMMLINLLTFRRVEARLELTLCSIQSPVKKVRTNSARESAFIFGRSVSIFLPMSCFETDMTAIARGDEQTRNGLLLLHPVRRFGIPEEVADAVLWLCSPGADFITGVALPVDGGFEAGAGVFLAS